MTQNYLACRQEKVLLPLAEVVGLRKVAEKTLESGALDWSV